MIDMHSHIIPGVDDGSKSVEETFNMIKEARNVGFTDIFMTSHYLAHYYEPTVQELIIWKEKLQELLDLKNIDVTLHSGMEIYVSNRIEELLKEGKLLTLASSNYALVELPINASISYLDYVVNTLEANHIQMILAHPERYVYVQDNIDLVDDFIEKGVLIQCNYASILGSYGKKAEHVIKKLLKHGKVDFLGSDCHKQDSVYTYIPEAVKKIRKIISHEEFLKISTSNPKKIINNEEW